MKNFALSITALLVLTAGGSWAAYHKALSHGHGAHGAKHGESHGETHTEEHGAATETTPAHTEHTEGTPAEHTTEPAHPEPAHQ